tara:strand:- start:14172 stop:15128 length:957 start_codon:yes stop_codon:yes gene_type:complete
MNENVNTKASLNTIDEIDLTKIFSIIWDDRKILYIISSIFAIAAVTFSLYLPNIYQSKALLSPIAEEDGMSSALRSYGGLAGLAGINLPSSSNDNNSVKALDKIQSLSFFTQSIFPNIYLPDLMAIKSWDAKNNKIIYKKNIFDETSQKWIRDFKYPQKQIPSAQESFEVFIKEHLDVSEDKNTGFITISIKHQSPHVAQQWTDLIVKEVNYFFRVKDKAEAQAAISFLNTQIAETSFTEIKQVIAQLLQQKTQQLSLIEVSDFYVFEYIDPPAIMEKKSEPNRALICILVTTLGGLLGALIILLRYYLFGSKKYLFQ